MKLKSILCCSVKTGKLWLYIPAGNVAFSGSNDFTHECDEVAVMCGRNRPQPIGKNSPYTIVAGHMAMDMV